MDKKPVDPNLIALLQLVDDYQRDNNLYFDIWANNSSHYLEATKMCDDGWFITYARVERGAE